MKRQAKKVSRSKSTMNESLSDMAGRVDKDHEVDLARSGLYQIAEYAVKLHDLLKNVPDDTDIEGWVQSKITLASDYMDEIFHHMEYELKPEGMSLGDEVDFGSELGMEDLPDKELEPMDEPTLAIGDPDSFKEIDDFESKLESILKSGMDRILNEGAEGAISTLQDAVKSGARSRRDLNPEQVKAMQTLLGITADGKYGPQTMKAVKEFQSSNMLTPDGDAGPRTIKVMTKVLSGPISSGKPFDKIEQPTGRDANAGGIDLRSKERMQAGDQPTPTQGAVASTATQRQTSGQVRRNSRANQAAKNSGFQGSYMSQNAGSSGRNGRGNV